MVSSKQCFGPSFHSPSRWHSKCVASLRRLTRGALRKVNFPRTIQLLTNSLPLLNRRLRSRGKRRSFDQTFAAQRLLRSNDLYARHVQSQPDTRKGFAQSESGCLHASGRLTSCSVERQSKPPSSPFFRSWIMKSEQSHYR